MSDQPTINPSLGMKVTLGGIRKRFHQVLQISTEDFYMTWYKGNLEYRSGTSSGVQEKKHLLLLDVREEPERKVSFIEGSVWLRASDSTEVNVQKVKDLVLEKIRTISQENVAGGNGNDGILQQEITIVAYCSIGYRSAALLNQIDKNTLLSPEKLSNVRINLFNLEGSIFKWANEGKPIVTLENQPTTLVHPYNRLWGSLLNVNLRSSY